MSTEKIDELLGIASGIDAYLDTLSVDSVSDQFKNIDDNVKSAVQNIDNQLSNYNISNIGTINIEVVENSLNDIKELIESSKQLIKHIHSCIVTTDLVDPELVQAFSKLLEATHLTVSEYLDLYKSRLSFVDKIKFSIFQQQQRKELLALKHKYDMEKLEAKTVTTTTEAESTVSYTQEELTKMLGKIDEEELQ